MSSYNESLVRQIAEREFERVVGKLLWRRIQRASSYPVDQFTRLRIERDLRKRLQPALDRALENAVEQALRSINTMERNN